MFKFVRRVWAAAFVSGILSGQFWCFFVVHIVDAAPPASGKLELVSQRRAPAGSYPVAFSPDGKILAIGTLDGAIGLVEYRNRKAAFIRLMGITMLFCPQRLVQTANHWYLGRRMEQARPFVGTSKLVTKVASWGGTLGRYTQ